MSERLPASRLDELRRLLSVFEERKERAAERADQSPKGGWYFALIGLDSVEPEVSLGEVGLLRRLEEPAGGVELASALKSPEGFTALGRYTPGIRHELVIGNDVDDASLALGIGWNAVAALRLRSGGRFVVPAIANCSWDHIAAAPPRSVWSQMLEDVPDAALRAANKPSAVGVDDAAWVTDNFERVYELRANPTFHFALESLAGHHLESETRMSAARLWWGLESLFDVGQEIRFRLALLVATLIDDVGTERVKTYRHVKDLYGVRSKIMHGAQVHPERELEHVDAVQALLQGCLSRIVEMGELPTVVDLEVRLLSGSP